MNDDFDFEMGVVDEDEPDEFGATGASNSSIPEPAVDDSESFSSEKQPFRLGDIPDDWSVSLVAEIAKGEKGLVDGDWVESKDMDEDGNIQLVQLGHIGEGQFKGQPNRFVNRGFVKEEDCTILSEGDLLISRMQEPILRSCLLPDFESDSIMAVDIARLQENDDWNRIFLKYLFNSRPIWKQGIAWASGTTRKRISRKNIEKIRLQKPPLPEQRKIASVLYAVDQAIQKTEAIIEQAKRVKRGLMQDLWTYGLDGISSANNQEKSSEALQETTVGRFPEDWDIVSLGSLTERITDGSHRAVETLPDGEEGIPFLYVSCIRNGKINWDKASSVSEEVYRDISEGKRPEAGVILYTAVGSYGHAVMLEGDERLSFQRHIAYIRPDESAIHSKFLAHWLDSVRAKKYADRVAQGNAQKTVTLHDLSNYPVPLPTRETQEEIAGFMDQFESRLHSEKRTQERLNRLKKALMQDLLTGEVRTADKAIDVLDEVVEHG